MTLQEAIVLRDAAKAAYLKSLQALSYQVGDGAGARQVQRNSSDKLKAEFLHWDATVTNLQNRAAGRARRVVYLR